MRIVVVHDYLTQKGGAERVALEIARTFPGSKILTSMYNPARTHPAYQDFHVETLPLVRKMASMRDPRLALPLLGDAFRREVVDADVVICSSSGFSHQIRTDAPKIVYCHNPPRWLHQWSDYSVGLEAPARVTMRVLRNRLLRQDAEGAASAASYIANSRNVAERIRTAYGIDAAVIHPPRGLEPGGPEEPVPGLAPGFALTVGRARGYKRTDLLKEAFAGMPGVTLVAVGAQGDARWPENIRHLFDVSDAQLRWLYRSASALLACSSEDFGLTPVEAFGFGTPVAATREGGYLETCLEGLTGLWLDTSSTAALRSSIRDVMGRAWDAQRIRAHGEQWTTSVFRSRLATHVARTVGGSKAPTPPAAL